MTANYQRIFLLTYALLLSTAQSSLSMANVVIRISSLEAETKDLGFAKTEAVRPSSWDKELSDQDKLDLRNKVLEETGKELAIEADDIDSSNSNFFILMSHERRTRQSKIKENLWVNSDLTDEYIEVLEVKPAPKSYLDKITGVASNIIYQYLAGSVTAIFITSMFFIDLTRGSDPQNKREFGNSPPKRKRKYDFSHIHLPEAKWSEYWKQERDYDNGLKSSSPYMNEHEALLLLQEYSSLTEPTKREGDRDITKLKKLTIKDLKRMFRTAALSCHPDKGGDAQKMKKLNEAWSIVQKKYLNTAN